MSLLSTREGRMSVMAREYARVVAHGLVALGTGSVGAVRGPRGAAGAGAMLVASALPHLRTAMAGAVEDRVLAHPPHVPAAEPPASSSCSAMQPMPDGTWQRQPCQELGSPQQAPRKSAARSPEQQTR